MHHHERIDGRGYPMGFAGRRDPRVRPDHRGGRRVRLDDLDPLLPRGRAPIAEGVDELRKGAGTQFDPAIVDAFIAALDREGWQLPEPADAPADRQTVTAQDHDDPTAPLRVIETLPDRHDDGRLTTRQADRATGHRGRPWTRAGCCCWPRVGDAGRWPRWPPAADRPTAVDCRPRSRSGCSSRSASCSGWPCPAAGRRRRSPWSARWPTRCCSGLQGPPHPVPRIRALAGHRGRRHRHGRRRAAAHRGGPAARADRDVHPAGHRGLRGVHLPAAGQPPLHLRRRALAARARR